MDEFDKRERIEAEAQGYDLNDDMYQQYEEMLDPAQAQLMADLEGLDPQQRAAYIQQLRLEAMAQDEYGGQEYDSDDEALFMDNNDLANRIWEDNELQENA